MYGYVPGDPALLKPGAAVFMVATKKPDGNLTAGRVTAPISPRCHATRTSGS